MTKTGRAVDEKQALSPGAWKLALCNKPAAGTQDRLWNQLLAPARVASICPFYIWHPVAKPALPSRQRSPGRRREARQASPASAVRWRGVRGCGEPTQAASPAPRRWRNPGGAGLGWLGVGKVTFPAQTGKPQGRLDWILGIISLLKAWSGIGPGCPGRWWSPHPWRGSKTVWMWHFRTCFSRRGGVGVTVGLDDLRGLFQP